MKISNSKKQLALIISENGGWREGNYAVQDKDDKCVWFMSQVVGKPSGANFWPGVKSKRIPCNKVLPNWHQTILSRDEYFHLYPAPDADGWIEWKGGECPVAEGTPIAIRHRDGAEFTAAFALGDWNVRWHHEGAAGDVVAYRLRGPEVKVVTKPERIVIEPEPTIEQLAAEYRNRKDYAERKQQEADAAKAEAEAKLAEMVAAGKAVGLAVSVAAPEPELVITDWWDLMVGDEIATTSGRKLTVTGIRQHDESWPIDADDEGGGEWCVSAHDWRFIRRPGKGADNA